MIKVPAHCAWHLMTAMGDFMDIQKTLAELREYRAQLTEAIAAFEALARVRNGAPRREAGHVRSDETRQRMAESQKKRWAAYRRSKQTANAGHKNSKAANSKAADSKSPKSPAKTKRSNSGHSA